MAEAMAGSMPAETIKMLPKVELHCHLDGSVPLAALGQMGAKNPGSLPTGETALRDLVQAPEGCRNLAEYLARFGPVLALLQDMDNLALAAKALVAELAAENVVYAELRFSPVLLTEGGASAETVVRTVLEALAVASAEHGVETRALLCMMRHHSEAENLAVLALAETFFGEGVAGVDLAGDEAAFPGQLYTGLFERVKAMGLPFTIHAGETGSTENVRHALKLGAARIGHGIAAAKDPALVRQLAERGTVLEVCPVSNLQTRAVADWADYPYPAFLEAGVNLAVNTDNRTVSNTSLTREFGVLSSHFSALDAARMQKHTLTALDAAFIPDALKTTLREKITQVYAQFVQT
ncbi:adenosine deaminase [Ruminococcaceae bacterium OttesenSCG-928-D13]|nr:adenosine deaminase [Ruminococcaceae bacterium OttesenSCG-928-D13]